ncbi:MAG: hypothetical protein BMS9Abin04_275 [Planctomycetia bacterium]|nr:MAG: hypothetical protein BMS9Abin04_275 [Planctomycetia bacterium]
MTHRFSACLLCALASLFGVEPGSAGEPAWDRTQPDSAIFLPAESSKDDRCNQQVVGIVTQNGTFLVTWTMASRESAADQRVVVSRSTDKGRTWSAPAVIDQDTKTNPGPASYSVPFQVPGTGRIYLFYLKNDGKAQVRSDITGFLVWQFSDDDGRSWHADNARFNMGKGEWTDTNPDAPGKPMEVTGVPKLGTTYLQIASYSSLVEYEGKVLLFYNDCKHWVLFKEIPADLLRCQLPARK